MDLRWIVGHKLILVNLHCIAEPLCNHLRSCRSFLKVVLVEVKQINDCKYGLLVPCGLFSLVQSPKLISEAPSIPMLNM
jgi:hypothetical protein